MDDDFTSKLFQVQVLESVSSDRNEWRTKFGSDSFMEMYGRYGLEEKLKGDYPAQSYSTLKLRLIFVPVGDYSLVYTLEETDFRAS